MRHTLTVRTISSCAISVKKATSPSASPPPQSDLQHRFTPLKDALHLTQHDQQPVHLRDDAGVSILCLMVIPIQVQSFPTATQVPGNIHVAK